MGFPLEEENLRPYRGRARPLVPVTTAASRALFWQADRHRKAVYTVFIGGTTPFDFTKN